MEKICNNAAYIVKKLIEVYGEMPGKKVLQKMVFLIEEKGIDLDFSYGLHFYGPYSRTLDLETTTLSADGIIKFDLFGNSHKMKINEDFEIQSDNLSCEQENEIDELIKRLKDMSPSDLELLTTAIYAYNHIKIDKTRENVIDGVVKIKGKKYTRAKINDSLKHFSFFEKEFAV